MAVLYLERQAGPQGKSQGRLSRVRITGGEGIAAEPGRLAAVGFREAAIGFLG
jgi:hypothetical protein